MKFPKAIQHRGKTLAKIYGRAGAYGMYRVSWTLHGKRQMKAFRAYGGPGGALEFAEKLVKDIGKGSTAAALTPRQATDALAALDVLESFRQRTGKDVSLVLMAREYVEAASKLNGHTMGEAVERYLNTVANVKRIDLAQAVTQFLEGRQHLSEAKDGKRSKHSADYEAHVSGWLKEFAAILPGHAVCDLTRAHLDLYISNFSELSSKSRNDRRTIVKQFLRWCCAKDFLAPTHRLFEAVAMKAETLEDLQIDFYRPTELRALLEGADKELLPVIALSGLAGLRIQECLRLEWSAVWREPGSIEISAKIAKGRARRLVSLCPSLAQWLEGYRSCSGLVSQMSPMDFNRAFVALRDSLKIPARRNGLRRAFITFHMAMNQNENMTAAEAGNSPAMIHEHYRGLATRTEAEKWFAVAPATAPNVVPMSAVGHPRG